MTELACGDWGGHSEKQKEGQDNKYDRSHSLAPTLYPKNVVPRGRPRRVTGCAFVETAVTGLGLGQTQGPRREEVMSIGMRGTGEIPTDPCLQETPQDPTQTSHLPQEACQD